MPVTCLYVYHSRCSVLLGHGMSLPPLPPFEYCSYYCVKCDNGATKWGRARALTDSERAEFNKLEKAKGTKRIRKAKKLCEAHGSGPASWQRTWDTQCVGRKRPLEQLEDPSTKNPRCEPTDKGSQKSSEGSENVKHPASQPATGNPQKMSWRQQYFCMMTRTAALRRHCWMVRKTAKGPLSRLELRVLQALVKRHVKSAGGTHILKVPAHARHHTYIRTAMAKKTAN